MPVKKNNDEIEIDLFKIISAIWKNALAIILAALLTGLMAFAFTFTFISPKYEATASFYVNNSSYSYGSNYSMSSSEFSASYNLVDTYIFVLKSRTTLEDAISKSGVDYTYSELSKMVSAEPVERTAGFTVTVASGDPAEAAVIANAIAEVLPDRISEIVSGCSVRVVDQPIIPSQRSSPSYTVNTLIGMILGGFMALIFVVVKLIVKEQQDEAIHSADELKELYPSIPVLALIPDMRVSNKKGHYYNYYYYADSKKTKKGGRA